MKTAEFRGGRGLKGILHVLGAGARLTGQRAVSRWSPPVTQKSPILRRAQREPEGEKTERCWQPQKTQRQLRCPSTGERVSYNTHAAKP